MIESAYMQSHIKGFIKITALVRLCTVNEMCKNKMV